MIAVVRSRFYPVIAAMLALLVFIGFARTYYLGFLFHAPRQTVLMHLHAIAFTGWMLLFVVQTRLIAARNYAMHMKLGIAGVVLAACTFVLGVVSTFATMYPVRPRPMGLGTFEFPAIPLFSIVLFGVFIGAAISLRRRAALHKRFMLLAMIAVLGPPMARLIRTFDFGDHFLAIQTTVAAAFLIAALAYDWFKNRIVHPVFAIGGLVVLLSWPLRVAIARSDAWVALMKSLTS